MQTLLIAPGEGADDVLASLAELEGTVEIVRADPVGVGDDAAAVAAALAGYEAQAKSAKPAAAIVHGSGDRPLAAAISLVKLEIPVARVSSTHDGDLTALVAGHSLSTGGSLAEQVSEWLRRILTP